ncbi:Ribosomal RNA-processing protein 7-like protein A [Trichoplax sp. H2]|nr:Ribosomal RNA-processing protein 7-like protein A [Trichoplax sp. H2]|eukprot:RDD43996.1 Ribosomal RNA-processing protein 7-like protein A [Trichoplax sp. H2]
MAALKEFLQMKVQFNEECQNQHIMYYKRHTVRQECQDIPSDRTLFIINVPPYCTKNILRQIFSLFGEIDDIYQLRQPANTIPQYAKEDSSSCFRRQLHTGFRVAYIVFKTPISLMKALKESCDDTVVLANLEEPPLVGYKKWCQEYAAERPAPQLLQSEIDQFMEDFQKREKLDESQNSNEPDDDGWVTVKRKNKYPIFSNEDQEQQQSKKKKKKKTDLINFYRFEVRESKREHIAQLRKKFEEDKKKIALMKETRRFKPY